LIAYAQRNRWSNDWYRYWFYVRTPRFTIKEENGEDAYRFPPPSNELSTRVVAEEIDRREACEMALENPADCSS